MEDNGELKAGHAPAQKVGGMRIVQHKHKEEKHEGSPPKMTDEDKEEFGEDRPTKTASVSHGVNLYTLDKMHIAYLCNDIFPPLWMALFGNFKIIRYF